MERITWKTEKRKIDDLKYHPSNPRSISKEDFSQLVNSVNKFDYVEIVVINLDNTILAGHMRIRALKNLKRGKEQIEVRVPSRMLTDEESKEYLVRSNKNTGEWDWEMLADAFDPVDLCAWGFSSKDFLLDVDEEIEDDEDDSDCEEKRCDKCGQKIKNKRKS